MIANLLGFSECVYFRNLLCSRFAQDYSGMLTDGAAIAHSGEAAHPFRSHSAHRSGA